MTDDIFSYINDRNKLWEKSEYADNAARQLRDNQTTIESLLIMLDQSGDCGRSYMVLRPFLLRDLEKTRAMVSLYETTFRTGVTTDATSTTSESSPSESSGEAGTITGSAKSPGGCGQGHEKLLFGV